MDNFSNPPPPPPDENDSFMNRRRGLNQRNTNSNEPPPPPPADESLLPNDSSVPPPPPANLSEIQRLKRNMEESPDYQTSKNLTNWRKSLYLFIAIVFCCSLVYVAFTCIDRHMCDFQGIDTEVFASAFLLVAIILYPFLSFLLYVATTNFLLSFLIFVVIILFVIAIVLLVFAIICLIFGLESFDGTEIWNELPSISQLFYTDIEGFRTYYKVNMVLTAIFLILIGISFAVMAGIAIVIRVKMGGNEQGARRKFGVVRFRKEEQGVIKRGQKSREKEILGFSLVDFLKVPPADHDLRS